MIIRVVRKISKEETLELQDEVRDSMKKDEILSTIRSLRAIAKAHEEKTV